MRIHNNVQRIKLLKNLIFELKNNIIIVEGKKDKFALQKLGCRDVYVIQGRKIESVLDRISQKIGPGKNREVIILTDMDTEGDRLSKEIGEICKGLSIHHNIMVRKRLSGLIHLRYWENINEKIEAFLRENEE